VRTPRSTIVWRESIGNWLYGVAFRTARKLRQQRERRERHEAVAAEGRAHVLSEHSEGREICQVLDEELIRLPEQFRMPVILCCLHDQTIDEAAYHLGVNFATIKGRLQRGRDASANGCADAVSSCPRACSARC
jgi:polysaccharide export outer membrane protein